MGFHFNICREDLLRAISTQQNITNKKGTLAILANILLQVETDHIILTATDLEIGLKHVVPAEVFEKGTITLPSKKLFELVRESGSNTLIFKEMDNQWVEITAESSLYRLAGIKSDEFPQFPDYDENTMISINGEIFSYLIDKTIFSIAQEKESMFTLNAALLTKERENEKPFIKMISSDGHRLTIMTKEVDDSIYSLNMNEKTLIPRRGIQEIKKFCDNKDTFLFGIEKKQAVFKTKDSLLIVRLLDGDFPDFNGLLNSLSNDNPININRNRFIEGLKRINLFTEDMFHAIKIDINENKMILTSQNADFGSAKDEFDISYNGTHLSIGFNCRYFIESLQVMEGEIITANIKSNDSPCVITSDEDEGFLSVIMPMKL